MNQPIIAYRIWKVSPEGRLSTAYRNSGKWPWMKPYSASCDKVHVAANNRSPYDPFFITALGVDTTTVADHDGPHFDCTCGLYGYKTVKCLEQTFPQYYTTNCVLGRVALWGKIVEHKDGYRAEYGYPQVLYYPDESMMDSRNWADGSAGKEMVAPIRLAAQKYGIDALPIPEDIKQAYLLWANLRKVGEEILQRRTEQYFARAWEKRNADTIRGKKHDFLVIDEHKKFDSQNYFDIWKGLI
jgi:hypothetical protein